MADEALRRGAKLLWRVTDGHAKARDTETEGADPVDDAGGEHGQLLRPDRGGDTHDERTVGFEAFGARSVGDPRADDLLPIGLGDGRSGGVLRVQSGVELADDVAQGHGARVGVASVATPALAWLEPAFEGSLGGPCLHGESSDNGERRAKPGQALAEGGRVAGGGVRHEGLGKRDRLV